MSQLTERKKYLLIGLTSVLVLLVAAVLFFGSIQILDGQLCLRNTEILDLRGRELRDLEKLKTFPNLKHLDLRGSSVTREQLEVLQKDLPDCEILWELDFQDQKLPPDAKNLKAKTLAQPDLQAIDQFPELEQISIETVEDYAALGTLPAPPGS